MAGISTPAMAAAVSNAGALGSVALGALGPDAARDTIRASRALTDNPIAANVFVHPTPVRDPALEQSFLEAVAPEFSAAGAQPPEKLTAPWRSFNDDSRLLDVLLEERPAVVSLHFGLAEPEAMEALKRSGITIIATATSLSEAQAVETAGVDVVVLQGSGAGGHNGAFLAPPDPATATRKGLFRLVGTVADAVSVPVLAAGGLMNGADVGEAIAAGASGAQLGTAFAACHESSANHAYRHALSVGGITRITSAVSGRPARGLVNEMLEFAEALPRPVPSYPLTYDGMKRLVAARNDPEFTPMWAGTGVDRTRALPAGELVAVLAAELDARLHNRDG